MFDSKMEADYYTYLLEQEEQGHIESLELQPVFLLQPSFKKMGRTIRKIVYKADFLVTYPDGEKVVVDVKGVLTADFKLKAKMFDYYNTKLELKLITFYKGEWMELKQKKALQGGTVHGKRVLPKRNRRKNV